MQFAEITLPNDKIGILCPNKGVTWRAETFWTKEPITIKWLEALTLEDILFDIGANIGLYSLYPAKIHGTRVYAFEPESQNFALLNANIKHNFLEDKITAYPVCLNDTLAMDFLNLSKWGTGGSCHTFGKEITFSGKEMEPAFRQGSISIDFWQAAEMINAKPTAVKIDVDGLEPEVLKGMLNQGPHELPRTVIVETNWNLEDHRGMVDDMVKSGYTFSQEQADEAKRKDGSFKDVGEVVFSRS